MSMENISVNKLCSNNCRREDELKDIICKVSFAMDDTRLYLDTHPYCKEALAFYKKMEKIRHEVIKEYTERYGEILCYYVDIDEWDWNDGDYPWKCSKKGGR